MPIEAKTGLRETVRAAFGGSLRRRAAFALLLAYLVAAPIPWGSVQPGVAGTGKIVVGALLIALLTFLSPDVRPRPGWAWLPAAAVAGIALLGVVQRIPLPVSVLKAISPASLEAWQGARDVLGAFGRTSPAPCISLAPAETDGVALLAASLAALFLAAASLLDSRARRRLFGAAVVASGVLQVVIAVSTQDRLSRLSGSFVNPNNFAGYLMVPLAFAFSLVWYQTRREVPGLARSSSPDRQYQRLERLLPRLAVSVALWATLAAGIFMSQSRGGLAAALGTTLLLFTLALLHRQTASRPDHPVLAASLGLALVAGTVFAVANAGKISFLRFYLKDGADLAEDYRILIWRHSADAFRMFPWLGSGLGTFREAFRRFQPAEIRGLVDQAHDEYLQLLVTGGAAGVILGLLAVGSSFLLFRSFFRQPHREESAFVLAGIGAATGLLVHGVAEFNFSIPAIPATLAAVLGAAWAAAGWHSSEAAGGPSE